MTKQIAIRIPDDLLEQLDELVAQGRFATRTDAVREALRALVESEERRRIDAAIVAGYRRHPPTAEELAWVDDSERDMIAEEPW